MYLKSSSKLPGYQRHKQLSRPLHVPLCGENVCRRWRLLAIA